MALLRETVEGELPSSMFDLNRSLAAYAARQAAAEKQFKAKVEELKQAIEDELKGQTDQAIFSLASRSGLPAGVLVRLKERVTTHIGSLPTSIQQWVIWTLEWLKEDNEARTLLLIDVAGAARGATGRKKAGEVSGEVLDDLRPGIIAWIKGKTVAEIEVVLGGDPNGGSKAQRVCPRSRDLIETVIPRAVSFILSIISYAVLELNPFGQQEGLSRELIEGLSTAVRLGFDELEKQAFASDDAKLLGRVQAHEAWAAEQRHH
jgi:hypothetical protein